MIIKRAPSFLSVSVLAVLVALSVVASLLIESSLDRQEHELLVEQTGQAARLIERPIDRIGFYLSSVGIGHSAASRKVFFDNANAARQRPTDTVVLVAKGTWNAHGKVTPGPPRAKLVAGTGFHSGELLGPELAHLALVARPVLSATLLNVGGKRSLVFFIKPPAIGVPGYAALEVVPAPGQLASVAGLYPKLDLALYATPRLRPAELIGSRQRTPVPRPTATAQVNDGPIDWTLVSAAREPLLDGAAEVTPWIVLGLGLILALAIAVTVETLTRRQREQRTVAETLQAALLPQALPQMGTTETAVRYLPGVGGIHVGGDWYDLIALDDTHLLAVVGDVSGRGLQAATVMATLLYATRAYAAEGHAPEVILSKLSGLISIKRSGHLATVLLILIDVEGQNITVVNGGPPPPLLLRDHQSEYVNAPVGLPVGVSSTPTYTPVTVPLPPGTTLLAFTDGLIERRGESWDVGLGRLRQAATADAEDSLEGLLSSLVGSLVGTGVADDTVLLGVHLASLDIPSHARIAPSVDDQPQPRECSRQADRAVLIGASCARQRPHLLGREDLDLATRAGRKLLDLCGGVAW